MPRQRHREVVRFARGDLTREPLERSRCPASCERAPGPPLSPPSWWGGVGASPAAVVLNAWPPDQRSLAGKQGLRTHPHLLNRTVWGREAETTHSSGDCLGNYGCRRSGCRVGRQRKREKMASGQDSKLVSRTGAGILVGRRREIRYCGAGDSGGWGVAWSQDRV